MANTYFNDIFIPNSFLWKDGKLREDLLPAGIIQTVILLIEAVSLGLLLFYINKRYLIEIAKASNANSIALRTEVIYGIITVTFIAILIYTAFK
jgi:hypothetical protein